MNWLWDMMFMMRVSGIGFRQGLGLDRRNCLVYMGWKVRLGRLYWKGERKTEYALLMLMIDE
jgi:hypothetical protein